MNRAESKFASEAWGTSRQLVFALFIVALLAHACTSPPKQAPQAEEYPDSHTSRNSLGWEGVYKGTIPCADCEGIITQLMLNHNNTFTLNSTYLADSVKTFKTYGQISWNQSMIRLTTEEGDSLFARVEEGRVRLLDMKGQVIEGDLAEMYLLQQVITKLKDVRWRLNMLGGEEVAQTKETPYLVFEGDNKVSGNAGCNNVMGSYKTLGADSIRFSQLASTRKMCVDMQLEERFLVFLNGVQRYELTNNKLKLHSSASEATAVFGLR